jgi:hypothetical protein
MRAVPAMARLWRWKLLLRPSAATIEQITSRKTQQRLGGHTHRDHPTVPVIVQSFTRCETWRRWKHGSAVPVRTS